MLGIGPLLLVIVVLAVSQRSIAQTDSGDGVARSLDWPTYASAAAIAGVAALLYWPRLPTGSEAMESFQAKAVMALFAGGGLVAALLAVSWLVARRWPKVALAIAILACVGAVMALGWLLSPL